MAVFLITDPRCVFIHIPKTGGASIRLGVFEGKVEGPKQGFVPENWNRLFKFSFVRNPYDRVVSAWRMFAGGMQQSIWEQPQDQAGINLNDFLDIVVDESVPFDGVRETTQQKIRHHAIPQTHPYNCLEHADYVGRFENLAADFGFVCDKLGIERRELPHKNKTERSVDYMQHFDARSLKIVNDFYAEDFAKLEYEVE